MLGVASFAELAFESDGADSVCADAVTAVSASAAAVPNQRTVRDPESLVVR